MKKSIFVSIFALAAASVCGKDLSGSAIPNRSNRTRLTEAAAAPASLSFIENKGQVTDQNHAQRNDIQFEVAAGPGLNIFIGDGAIHYQFNKPNEATNTKMEDELPGAKAINPLPATYTMYRMDVELVGANKYAQVITGEKTDYYENHFVASTGKYTTTATFGKIVYKDIYPNIDWVLYISDGQLKHEFAVRAGGNAGDIKIKYGGATGLKLNGNGELIATTPLGGITEQAPKTYQANGRPVSSSFNLNGDVLSYKIGSHSGGIVIDPVLVWGTYYGGTGDDNPYSSAVDNLGNVYICGYTSSASAIATSGAYMTTIGGSTDAFLAKFSKAGTRLWATYYGGSSDDYGRAVATDASGNVYMAGSTSSTSGIATPGAYQTVYLWGDDAFLVKFNSSGAIQWGTYYGGSNSDYINGIAVDGSGNASVTGETMSSTGIATAGAFRTSFSGSYDAFLAKFNTTGSLQWGTYYGGSSADYGYGVAYDGSGNVYIDGYTASPSTMTTTGAYQTVLNGVYDAYLAKFNAAGTIQWATYVGGDNADMAYGLSVTGPGYVYLTGNTYSTSSLATPGAYQTVYGGGGDAFVAKFDNAGAIQWASYFGGSDLDEGHSIGTNAGGDIYFTGVTRSTSAIATPGAYQVVPGGVSDVYLAKFNSSGAISWATYYGGSSNESPNYLSVGDSDNVYIAGYTQSTSGIATPGAYQTTPGGSADAFLARFNFCDMPVVGTISGLTSMCVGNSITLSNTTSGGAWSSSNPAVATAGSTGIVTGIAAGVDTIRYSVSNLCGVTTVTMSVTINPLPDAGTIIGGDTICIGSSITLTDASPGGVWSEGNGNATIVDGVVTGISEGEDIIKYSVSNACGAAHTDKAVYIIRCTTGVTIEQGLPDNIVIYPNPAQGTITISSPENINNVVVSNLLGQIILSGTYSTKSVALDLSRQSNGVYILRINNNRIYKVIKQ